MAYRLDGTKPLSEPMLDILFIEPLGTNVSEISIKIQTSSFKKMQLEMLTATWHPLCLSLKFILLNG